MFTRKQIGEKAQEKICRVYVGFIDLEKEYDRVNRKTLCQVLKLYDVNSKLLHGMKSMYVKNLAYVKVKGDESGCFLMNG